MVEKGRQTSDKKEGRKPWTLREFGGQTVWDWLHLLSALAIPVVLAAAGLWFTAQQDQRQQEIEGHRAKQAQKIEDQRAEAERELAEKRAQDEALQAYLAQMSTLLLEKNLRNSGSSEEVTEVRTLARARTLTVLRRLDPNRKTALMQFLVEADLVQRVDGRDPIISLRGADLHDAELTGPFQSDLSGADLSSADLSGAYLNGAYLNGADLSGAYLNDADLRDAYLPNADLRDAYLTGAYLGRADLNDADLTGADLTGAYLNDADLSNANLSFVTNLSDANLSNADLSNADLSDANLSDADLSNADLSNADLSNANLSGANLSIADLSNANLSGVFKITNEELEQQAISLKGATMPNGQQYEDWLKSRGENGN